MNNIGDRIAQLCFDKYNSLKKTGKPKENEWTVLAGIVLKDTRESLSVISLATGTKCLGGSDLMDTKRLWERGTRLSDSHAEVLARRTFLRYLYHQINLAFSNNSSDIFQLDTNSREINLRNDISFHYFCSQTPCGDCSIFPKTFHEKGDTDSKLCNGSIKKRKISSGEEIETTKEATINKDNSNICNDVHRTGAKCLNTEKKQDPYLPGINYHVVGPLRIKPGRGDRTLSLSCSDKIAKWNALGIQGALLSRFIPPIKMNSFCIGGESPFSLEAMRRGIYGRFTIDEHYCPVILQSERSFIHKKDSTRTQPCPSSVVWCAVPNRELEISVDGRKQGVTKKKTRGNYLFISRKELFKTFLKTLDQFGKIGNCELNHPKKITYFHAKRSSAAYQQSWRELKSKSFHAWPEKPLYLQDFVST